MLDRRTFTSAANGRKSHGPVTPEGKSRSRLNATTHGILAQFGLVRHEHPGGLEQVTRAYFTRFQPQDDVEEGLIEEMIHANWKTRRIWAIENTFMNQEIDKQTSRNPAVRVAGGFETLSETSKFKNLQRYEAHHANRHRRAMQMFIDLRKKVPLPAESLEEECVIEDGPPEQMSPDSPIQKETTAPNPAPPQPESEPAASPMPVTINTAPPAARPDPQSATTDNKTQPRQDPGSGRKVA